MTTTSEFITALFCQVDDQLSGRFCRKFSFEAICGMVSPSNPWSKGEERRWR